MPPVSNRVVSSHRLIVSIWNSLTANYASSAVLITHARCVPDVKVAYIYIVRYICSSMMLSDVQLITKTDTKQLSGNCQKVAMTCIKCGARWSDGASFGYLQVSCNLQRGVRLEINTLPANLIFMQFSWGRENFLPGKVTALPSGCRCRSCCCNASWQDSPWKSVKN